MISPNKIKAVLFDLDGTLRHHLPSGGEVFVKYVRSLGANFSEEDRIRSDHWEHQYFASSPEVQADNQKFKDDLKAFWVNFAIRRLVALGLHATQANKLAPKISDYMDTSYKPEVHVPEDAHTLLAALHEAGYILGVVSNRDDPFQEELEKSKAEFLFPFCACGRGGEIL